MGHRFGAGEVPALSTRRNGRTVTSSVELEYAASYGVMWSSQG